MTIDIAQIITDRIISELEKGATPWVKPWKRLRSTPGHGMPFNPVSGTLYRGVNHFWLSMMQGSYETPYWLTFKQAQGLGASVKAGAKGTPVVYWSINKKESKDSTGETVTSAYAFIKHYYVFNADQIDDLVIPAIPEPPKPDFDADSNVMALVDKLGLENGLTHGGDSAFYSPTRDFISMPPMAAFNSANGYHSTLLHESVHATGHKSRLDRDFSKRFGDESYAFEELVAELGSAMLCAHCGIDGEMQENHVAYIANWLKVLRNDKKAILTASAKAQQALDFLTKAKQVEESESLAA
jgi:antirestriction protein ArdC